MELAFRQFFNLKELVLVFRHIQEDGHSERDYQDIYDAAELKSYKSYEHHIQSVLAALVSRKRQNMNLQEIQLTDLTCSIGRLIFPEDPLWKPFTILLTGLMRHAPRLRLVDSDLVLALLS